MARGVSLLTLSSVEARQMEYKQRLTHSLTRSLVACSGAALCPASRARACSLAAPPPGWALARRGRGAGGGRTALVVSYLFILRLIIRCCGCYSCRPLTAGPSCCLSWPGRGPTSRAAPPSPGSVPSRQAGWSRAPASPPSARTRSCAAAAASSRSTAAAFSRSRPCWLARGRSPRCPG